MGQLLRGKIMPKYVSKDNIDSIMSKAKTAWGGGN